MQTVETWKGEEIHVPVKEPTVPMIGPPEEQIPATAANATVPLGALVQVSTSVPPIFICLYLDLVVWKRTYNHDGPPGL